MKPIKQFMVVALSNDIWIIVQASYDDSSYVSRATCNNYDDAKYLCEMLNSDWERGLGQSNA